MRLIPFNKMQRELMPSWTLFDDFVHKFFSEDFIENSRLMAVDVIETEKNFEIKANLPGVKKEDIKISIKENQLFISASTVEKKVENTENLIRSERYVGQYQRLFTLPENSDKDNIKAVMEQGVLSLQIPKKEPIPKKEIVVE